MVLGMSDAEQFKKEPTYFLDKAGRHCKEGPAGSGYDS